MSVWTHVAAIVRIDAIRFVAPGISAAVYRHFNADIPRGSEGPLDVDIYESPDLHSAAAYVVSIHGDLRDFADANSVVRWLSDKCHSVPISCMIRQAVALVEVEDGQSVTWRWGGDGSG